jgi:gliding motility-associated-like protein
MWCKKLFLLLTLLISAHAYGQTNVCPPNINFEDGNLNHWLFSTGSCCPIVTPVNTGALPNRHVLTSGTATDQYGNFPIVAPGGGSYSLKIGNNSTGAQSERARYYVRVPAGVNNYSLILRYAVVFQDPKHDTVDQPRFEVKGYDSATGAPVPCAQFTYVASSVLPGFVKSAIGSNIYYKSWSTVSVNLSGYSGKTIAMDFASGDCKLGGHFGYGYVDLSCGLFQISTAVCAVTPTTTLVGPPGFAVYKWMDETLTTLLGTQDTLIVPTPASSRKYALILEPYAGFGCPDTLYTDVNVFKLQIDKTADTTICIGDTTLLQTTVQSNAFPVTYSWTPAAGLSCTNCPSPKAFPTTNTTYKLTVTDRNGCQQTDSIRIYVYDPPNVTFGGNDVSCFGGSNGTSIAMPTDPYPPYTYEWNTVPVNTTNTITNLAAGVYAVKITNGKGCVTIVKDTITQPLPLDGTVAGQTSCYNGTDGKLTATPTGGTPPYTYAWNTIPVQTTATATGLLVQSYTVMVTDAKGCAKSLSGTVGHPSQISATTSTVMALCFGSATGKADVMATGGTPPYTYSWNSTPVQNTKQAVGLVAGTYTVTVKDNNGCTNAFTATVTQPTQLLASTSKTNVSCNGGSNGTATVIATGSTSPYTYSWNTTPAQTTLTATGLSAGVYSVTVTDPNGCTVTTSETIGEPSPLDVNVNIVDVACNGGANGSVTAIPAGGTSPYVYSWNTTPVRTTATINNLLPGTYTVLVTDAKGCTKSSTTNVVQPSILTASIIPTHVSCFGGANGSLSLTPIGGTAPYTQVWNTTPAQTAATISGLTVGSYSVTVTDGKGCTKTFTETITQPVQITASIAVTNVNCYGTNDGSAEITAANGVPPYTYQWSTNPLQTGKLATGLTAGNYTVIVKDNNNCTRSFTTAITQPTELTLTMSKTDVSCNGGNNGSAGVLATGGTAPYTYIWNTTPQLFTNTINNLMSKRYIVQVLDAKGCIRVDSQDVLQPPPITAVVTGTDVKCNSENTGSAGVTVSGGVAPYEYLWNTTPGRTTAAITGVVAGSYTVKVTDANGCIRNFTRTITQPPAIVANVTKTDIPCFGQANGEASLNVTGGAGGYSYTWNTTPVQTTPAITGLRAGVYTASVKDANNCAKAYNITIAQPGELLASVNKSDVSCKSDSSGKAVVVVTGGTTPYVYAWSGLSLTGNTADKLPVGTYIVNVTDAKGCVTQKTISISEPDELTAIVTKTDIKCYGGSDGSASVVPDGGVPPYKYHWNTTPVQTVNTVNNLAARTYTATITDANGCITTKTVEPIQPGDISFLTDNLKPACPNTAEGTLCIYGLNGGTPPYKYTWNTTPSKFTDTVTNLKPGIYSVSVTDAIGCSKAVEVEVKSNPAPNVEAGADRVICPGDTVLLTATGAQNYTWHPSNGLSCTDCSVTVARPYISRNYQVIGVNEFNCIDTADVNVNIRERKGTHVDDDVNICEGEKTTLRAFGGIEYTWYPATGLDNNKSASPVVYPFTDARYMVVIKENECYTDTLYQQVKVHPRPTIQLASDTFAIPGAILPLVKHVANATSIAWTPSMGLNCSDCFNPLASLQSTMTYKAVVTNDSLCFAEDEITIKVACDGSLVFVPNTFTPNGDGVNDRFYASADAISVINIMRVYNRWGEIMFEAKNVRPGSEMEGWDGTHKGRPLSPDVYVYYLEIQCVNAQKIFLKGDISLVR